MTHTLTWRGAMPFARSLDLDAALQRQPLRQVHASPKARQAAQRRVRVQRPPMHALLADAQGVWAWAPLDRHAPAMRHASLSHWMRVNPGSDMQLWVSGHFVRSLQRDSSAASADDATLLAHARRELVARHGEGAASWPLASWKNDVAIGVCALEGIDLEGLLELAQRDAVQVHSVMPWWYHAFQEALRCVNALQNAARAHVCVVEGRQIAWLETSYGRLVEMQQVTLERAHVDCLGEVMRSLATSGHWPTTPSVVLGQGLEDGARTQALDALVLGRLDGHQPPQWLRPSLQTEAH